jgi:REP element-mobilizing transposase RayT
MASHPHARRFKSADKTAIYHCISRTINGEKLFGDAEKEMLRKHLHQAAEFSGVELITYVAMSNHFHVLVRIPEQGVVSDEELVRRYKALYPTPTKWQQMHISVMVEILKAGGGEAQKIREGLLRRMNDVSEFMATFKHRFAIWFNRSHGRFGHLWSERFTSTIIEGGGHFALQMVAAYVDLNPVRAGLVKDPKDYRFCGYAEAESGNNTLIRGLRLAMDSGEQVLDTDEKVLASYRVGLFGKGTAQKRGNPNAARISEEAFQQVSAASGKLGITERLGRRVSWFTRGLVIGGRQFVEEHLAQYRQSTRRRQHIAPQPFAGDKTEKGTSLWNRLFTLRRHN